MNNLNKLGISISFNPDLQEQSVLEGELILIQSILPEVLKEILIQAEINKE